MNKKEEFEKLVQEFIDSKNELEMFLDLEDIQYNAGNNTVDINSFKAAIITTVLASINMDVLEGYSESLAEDLDDE